ncbi:MAG: hypothetical protein K2W96_01975 [Gemmataceae bacterium]|nr:hypothetical protein [Gemmataceae bacterium]
MIGALLMTVAACIAAKPVDPKKGPAVPESMYLAGTKTPDTAALGGFGPSMHLPVKLRSLVSFPAGELSVRVVRHKAVEPGEKAETLLWIANRTKGDAWLSACDSRVYLVLERKGEDGKWQAVEGMPTTSCGNSFHRVAAGPGEGWSFAVVPTEGKETLRYRLLPDGAHAGKGARAAVVSNEFKGSLPERMKPPAKK